MKLGHLITLVGAALVVVGATALDWLHIPAAAASANGYGAPPAGQIVLGLALLLGATSFGGLVSRSAQGGRLGKAQLLIGGFLGAWLLAAWLSRGSAFDSTTDGALAVEVGSGFVLAACGALVAFGGAVLSSVTARRTRLETPKLKVSLLLGNETLDERLLDARRGCAVGGPENATLAPEAESEGPVFRVDGKGRAWLRLGAGGGGRLTLSGRPFPLPDGPQETLLPLGPRDWGLLCLEAARVFFHFVRRAARRDVPSANRYAAAATVAALVVQAGFLFTSVLAWDAAKKAELAAGLLDRQPPIGVRVERASTAPERPYEAPAPSVEAPAAPTEEDAKPLEVRRRHAKKSSAEAEKPARRPRSKGLTSLLASGTEVGPLGEILASNGRDLADRIGDAMSRPTLPEGAGGTPQTAAIGYVGAAARHGDRIAAQGSLEPSNIARRPAVLTRRAPRQVVAGPTTRRLASVGSCSQRDVGRVVRRRLPAIRACYERFLALKQKPTAGKISVRWTIDGDGRVSGAHVRSHSLKDARLHGCILRAVRRMHFAQPKAGICQVEWPFAFAIHAR